jgi:hypothetical protein
VDHRGDGQAADELGNEPVLDEVLRQRTLEQVAGVLVVLRRHRRPEAHALVADPPLHDLVELCERPAADEQDVRGVDREELLVRMLAPALGRH